jgi:hypothetical protein
MTGRRLWYCAGPTKEQAATAVFDDHNVYASAGFPDKRIIAVRADGLGDVTKTHLLWTLPRNGSFVPSPLLADGLLYVVNDHGLAMCLDPKTGETIWTEKLHGEFSASPVLLGDKIFVPNEDGLMYIFKTGRRYEEAAANDLKDGGFATPVLCAGRIYLRTVHHLYCLGKSESKSP